jgi:myo-inositol-1(or 4)-monophosphatase
MQRELAVAVEAARAASAAILEVYRRADHGVVQKSDDRGPLTEADLAADRILRDALLGAFPDDGWLSEESADDVTRCEKRRCWVVDPLDGTREFTLRIPEFVVSVGLVIDGAPVLGVLVQPVSGFTVAGVVGQGCTANGAPCHTSQTADVAQARLLVSRSELEKGGFGALGARVEPMGSVAYKFALVAAGLADATFTPKPRNEWDLCGGVAAVLAAGGTACDGAGRPYLFNQPNPLRTGVIGTNGPLHAAIVALNRSLA